MSTTIHPTAMVSPGASLGENVTIGAYAIVGEHVKLGANTVIDAFGQVLGFTEMGKDCRVFSYAVVGNIPQDLKYKGDKSYLTIGDNNKIREFVTINPGTEKDTKTVIGSNNLVMAYSHIAHDCVIGSGNVLANATTLAGHVIIEDKVTIGGLTAVHQFCRIGSHAIIGGCSKVVQDVPPYSMSDGHPAVVYGLNLVGLRRANFSTETIKILKNAFKILFFENHPFDQAKEKVKKEMPATKEIAYLLEFISLTKRGIGR